MYKFLSSPQSESTKIEPGKLTITKLQLPEH